MKIVSGNNLREALFRIINEAKKVFVIVSPYIKLENFEKWEKILEKLKQKSERGLFIEIHTRIKYDRKLRKGYTEEEKKRIYQICKECETCKINTVTKTKENFQGIFLDNIYIHKNLHAKLYFNETTALITSLNLYDYSIENNIEIGCILENSEYKKALKQFYEKCLIKTNITIKEKINELENNLNNTGRKYFSVCYEQNKIKIDNKKFIIYCSLNQWMDRSEYQYQELQFPDHDYENDGLLEPHNEYLLKFNIIIKDDVSYSQVENNFYDLIEKHSMPLNYYSDKNTRTIDFSSDFVSEYRWDKLGNKPINSILHYNDIRNVFYSVEPNDAFNSYIGHIVITLRNILYRNKTKNGT